MATELVSGAMVTPNVRLVRELGRGGMGSVWVADHLSLHTQVAVKFVSAELVASDETMVARFHREAALCAQMKSPHVVQTFDHGVTADGVPYLVMELLEGESLAERLDRGRLSIAETRMVVDQVGKALGRAHKLGIVHRDIKPDNIFLVRHDDELVCKVLDFGVAKQSGMAGYSVVTATGAMVGTPEYMSPEQVLSAKAVDHRSDLWALAVVAYHALTGVVPFRGETLGSLCVAIARAEPTPPSSLRPELSPALDAWFARALAADPDARFASARELVAALDAAVAGTPAERAAAEPGGSGAETGPGGAAAESAPRLFDARTMREGSRETVTFAGATSPVAAARTRRGRIALVGLLLATAAAAAVALVVAGGVTSSPGAPDSAEAATGAPTTHAAAPSPSSVGTPTVTSAETPPPTSAAASGAPTVSADASGSPPPASATANLPEPPPTSTVAPKTTSTVAPKTTSTAAPKTTSTSTAAPKTTSTTTAAPKTTSTSTAAPKTTSTSTAAPTSTSKDHGF